MRMAWRASIALKTSDPRFLMGKHVSSVRTERPGGSGGAPEVSGVDLGS